MRVTQFFQYVRPFIFLKRFLPKTLLGRSLMIIVTPLIILQVVSAIIFFDRHWETVTRRLTSAIAGEIGFVIEELNSISSRVIAW